MLIEGMEKPDSNLHEYYMSRAEDKAYFVPWVGKAAGPGPPGTWIHKGHRRAISDRKEYDWGWGEGVGPADAGQP